MRTSTPFYYILDDDHNLVPADDRAVQIWRAEKPDGHRVAKTEIENFTVSTVFLIYTTLAPTGEPVMFETLIEGHPEFKHIQDRWFTWDEAVKGHEYWVGCVRDFLESPKTVQAAQAEQQQKLAVNTDRRLRVRKRNKPL